MKFRIQILCVVGCALLSACSGAVQQQASAVGRSLPQSAVGGRKTTLTLPKNIDPTGAAHTVAVGTVAYAVPTHMVTYSSSAQAGAEVNQEVYGNISTSVQGGQLVLTNTAGQVWHFPLNATVTAVRPAISFVAPGAPVPGVDKDLSPIAVAQ